MFQTQNLHVKETVRLLTPRALKAQLPASEEANATVVTSRDVAELAAEMCGPLFAKTTGAQVPVDGGNERVI